MKYYKLMKISQVIELLAMSVLNGFLFYLFLGFFTYKELFSKLYMCFIIIGSVFLVSSIIMIKYLNTYFNNTNNKHMEKDKSKFDDHNVIYAVMILNLFINSILISFSIYKATIFDKIISIPSGILHEFVIAIIMSLSVKCINIVKDKTNDIYKLINDNIKQ